MTPQLCRTSGTCPDMCARFSGVGLIPPVTPITHDTWSGSESRPMSINGSRLATCPESKHSCSGRIPSSFITVTNSMIVSNEFSNTVLKTKSFRFDEYFA